MPVHFVNIRIDAACKLNISTMPVQLYVTHSVRNSGATRLGLG
jgi:hypothetical protein